MLSQQKNWSDEQNSIYSEVLRTAKSQGQHKLSCPSCSHMRKKNKSDKPLSVNIDGSKIFYSKKPKYPNSNGSKYFAFMAGRLKNHGA